MAEQESAAGWAGWNTAYTKFWLGGPQTTVHLTPLIIGLYVC